MRRSLLRTYGLSASAAVPAPLLPPPRPGATRVLLENGQPFDLMAPTAPAVYAPPPRRA